MACFAPQNVKKFYKHCCGNENVLAFIGQPLGGFHGHMMVLILGAKQRDETAGVSDDNALATCLHRGIRQSARTSPRAPSPAAPPQAWRTEARRRLLSRALRGRKHPDPCPPAPGSLQPRACFRASLEALYPVLVSLLNKPVFE